MRRTGIVPNGPKIREALLHVIREADRRGKALTQFEILKTLFVADRAHLNQYGRPITFDEYVAMKDGPVPSVAYNLLKGDAAVMAETKVTDPLWSSEPKGDGKIAFSNAVRDGSDEILSESDFDELDAALETILRLGVTKTWEMVHEDPAYKDAWAKKRPGAKQHPMDYALLFKEPNPDLADDIKFISANL